MALYKNSSGFDPRFLITQAESQKGVNVVQWYSVEKSVFDVWIMELQPMFEYINAVEWKSTLLGVM